MSLYKEVLDPETFVPTAIKYLKEETGQENPRIKDIEAIVLRTGSKKGRWMAPLFYDLEMPVITNPPEFQEDAYPSYLSPPKMAASKTTDRNRDMREIAGTFGKEGLTLSIGTDVDLLDSEGKELKRPIQVNSLAEIEEIMNSILGREEDLKFTARTSIAIFGRRNDTQGEGIGLTALVKYPFLIKPFAPEEIEFYIYGLKGRDGSYPGYLRTIFKGLIKQENLDTIEIERLKEGFQLWELKLTNLGCRWPHPLMQNHIISIDGVSEADQEDFRNKRLGLYLALLGSPVETRDLLNQYFNFHPQDFSRQASLYSEISGTWGQLMRLKNGEYMITTSITPGDYGPISEMVCNNFLHADTYRYLRTDSPEIITRYCQANSPSGIQESCSHSGNIAAIVSKNLSGEIVGCGWIRAGLHPVNQALVTNVKRLHVSLPIQENGLGGQLMGLFEQMAKERSLNELIVQISSQSSDAFQSFGYSPVPGAPTRNNDGVFGHNAAPVVYMSKKI